MATTRQFKIPIIGKTIGLIFQGLENFEMVARHFPAVDPGGAPDFEISVLGGDALPADPDMPLRLDGHGEYAGGLDLVHRKGWVRLTGSWPADGLANFLRQAALRLVYENGGAVIHGACVVRGDDAYIFFGPSGAGKTTVCGLSEGCEVANDDLTAVLKCGARLQAWGLPRAKRFPSISSRSGPFAIRALFSLAQDTRTFLEPLPAALALARLTALPKQPGEGQAEQTLRIMAELADAVPCYTLHFTKSRDFWNCIEAELGVNT